MERRLYRSDVQICVALICLSVSLALLSCTARKTTMNTPPPGTNLFFERWDITTGERISMESLIEDDWVVLLNFWGVRCVPCLEEIEELNRLYTDKLNGHKIKLIAVNTDGVGDDELIKSLKANDIDIRFSVVSDPDMEISDFYTNGLIPHNVVITRDGGREIEIIGYNEKLFQKLQDKLVELAGNR